MIHHKSYIIVTRFDLTCDIPYQKVLHSQTIIIIGVIG